MPCWRPVHCCVFVAAVCLAGAAGAQTVLVETVALAGTHEPAAAYLQTVDLTQSALASGLVRMPGNATMSVMTAGPVPEYLYVLSEARGYGLGRPGEGITLITRFSLGPLWRDSIPCVAGGPQTHSRLAAVTSDPETGEPLAVMLRTSASEPAQSGTYGIDVLGCVQCEGTRRVEQRASWLLPGIPHCVVALPQPASVAVICSEKGEERIILHVRDVVTGKVPVEALPLPEPPEIPLGFTPVAATLGRDAGHLFVLASGYAMDDPSGRPCSWFWALVSSDLTAGFPPLDVAGTGEGVDQPLVPSDPDGCWIATRSPREGFAFATRVVPAAGLTKVEELSFTECVSQFRVVPRAGGGAAAVAADNRIEVHTWPPSSIAKRTFDMTIGGLCWTPAGLVAGEGNSLHLLDPSSAQDLAVTPLSSGFVRGVFPVPDPGDSERDADGDGIPDRVDPEPTVPSPRLEVPAVVSLRAEAAGREVRAIHIDSANVGRASWNASFAHDAMPWLRAYPLQGVTPDRVFVGIDPALYGPPFGGASGTLTIALEGTRPGLEASGSPAHVHIEVLPLGSRIRRVLWTLASEDPNQRIRAAADPCGVKGLVDLLAGPPFHFSHETPGPLRTASLNSYAIVVMDIEAAVRAGITQASVLNYVANGGALLAIGRHIPESDLSPHLRRWLAPLGIRLDLTSPVSGSFDTPIRAGLVRNWESFRIDDGCLMWADPPSRALVPGRDTPDEAILAAGYYGSGRFAVLAGAGPLATRGIAQKANARFASDLFGWLSSTGMPARDWPSRVSP